MSRSSPIGKKIKEIWFVMVSKPAASVFKKEGGAGKTCEFDVFIDVIFVFKRTLNFTISKIKQRVR